MDTTRRSNQDAPERWQQALNRAIAQGVTVRQLAGSGAWIATSGTDSEAAYIVTRDTCECHAGEAGDPVCKHRAALRRRLGLLAIPAVVIEFETVAPATPICRDCAGSGMVRYHQGGGLSNWIEVRCRRCSLVLAA